MYRKIRVWLNEYICSTKNGIKTKLGLFSHDIIVLLLWDLCKLSLTVTYVCATKYGCRVPQNTGFISRSYVQLALSMKF